MECIDSPDLATQSLGADHARNPAPDPNGGKFSGREIRPDAGGGKAPAYSHDELGNEATLEYGIASGYSNRDCSRRQLKPTQGPIHKCAQNS